jgi:hypothetical protein
VASFRSLDKNDPEFSWWNQKDTRIDSLQSELPDELLKVIRVESLDNAKTNRFLLPDDERIKEEKFLKKYNSYSLEEAMPEPIAEERIGRVRRAMERNAEEEIGMEMGEIERSLDDLVPVRRLVDAYEDNDITETESGPSETTNIRW